MPIPSNDRCSFEVVYRKNAEGIEVIEHVVVRTGLSDASVTLTIPQVYNLARLLDIVQQVNERNGPDRNGSPDPMKALPKAHIVRSE